MLRYISVHWDPRSAVASQTAESACHRLALFADQWKVLLSSPGLRTFAAPRDIDQVAVHALAGNTGIVLGTVFRRDRSLSRFAREFVSHFGVAESAAISASGGRALIADYWGSYVAILEDPTYGSRVLRSPLARLKCFLVQSRGVSFFFSHIHDYSTLELPALTIDWECISAQAACADYIGRGTALKEVSAIEAGECVTLTQQGRTRRDFYWHPCEISKEDSVDSFNDAVNATREAAHVSVQSWALAYEGAACRLSGGLDSSISVVCARKVLPRSRLPCLHYYSDDRCGDERLFARSVAESVDVELVESERPSNVDLEIFRNCAPTAWPMLDFSGYGQYKMEVAFARSRSLNAIFCGELGDNLFEHSGSYEAPADYVWRRGIRPGLIPVVIDGAIRRNFSVWKVLSRAIVDGYSTAKASRWNSHNFAERELGMKITDLTIVTSEALLRTREAAARFIHPWLHKIAGAPPAKFLMIYGMAIWNAYDPPFGCWDDPVVVAPLASQPLAETCLRIPTYFTNSGGVSRAVARRAFEPDLPRLVATRTTKGTPEPWTREVVRKNQGFLRDFLLNGALVAEKILDRKKLEALLSNEMGASRIFISDLIVQLYIEAWLQRWRDKSWRAAA